MKKQVVSTFITSIHLRIRESPLCLEGESEYNKAILEFNEYHTGQKLFPFDEEIPPSKTGISMQDLHHRLLAPQVAEIVVEVLEDGSLRVKKDQGDIYNE